MKLEGVTIVSRTILRIASLLRLRRGRVRCSTHGPPCVLRRSTPSGRRSASGGMTVVGVEGGSMMVAAMVEVRCAGCATPPPMKAAGAELVSRPSIARGCDLVQASAQ